MKELPLDKHSIRHVSPAHDATGTLPQFVRYVWQHPSPLRNRLAAFGRFALRQAHKRTASGSLVVDWEGMELEVAGSSTSAAAAYYLGRPDWWEFDFIERVLRPGDTVVDVGANVGVYTLFLAKRVSPAGCVVACEPDERNASMLRANLLRNRFYAVAVVESAVGDRMGAAPFLSGLGTVSRLAPEARATSRVPLRTLDALCGSARPVFVKVDVEGYEDAVLRGARRLMSRGFPKIWQLEVDPGRTAQTARLEEELSGFGYQSFVWDIAAGTLKPRPLQNPLGNNLLAIADLGFVQRRLGSAERRKPRQPGQ